MILRPAVAADAEEIAALWNRMIRDTLFTFTTEEKTAEGITALIAARPDAFWVAREDKLSGFVTYGPFRAGPGYAATVEHSILLDKAARGQGLGRLLMQRAETAAAEQGAHVMVAGISGANPGAVKFHAALGFRESGHMAEVGRKNGRWLDLILMQKTLHRH